MNEHIPCYFLFVFLFQINYFCKKKFFVFVFISCDPIIVSGCVRLFSFLHQCILGLYFGKKKSFIFRKENGSVHYSSPAYRAISDWFLRRPRFQDAF